MELKPILSTLFGSFARAFWTVTLTSIFVILLVTNSITESIKTKSFMPVVKEVGMRMLTAETAIERDVNYLISNPEKIHINEEKYVQSLNNPAFDRWERTKTYTKIIINRTLAYLNIISSLWLIFVVGFLLYTLINKWNTQNEWMAVVYAVLAIIIIEIVAGAIFLAYNASNDKSDKGLTLAQVGKAINPFRGITAIIKNWDFLVGDFLIQIQKPLEQTQQIEQSILEKRL